MEKFFKLKQNHTTVSTEITAGLTTFMTMAYILIVNPSLLGASGMNPQSVFTATALSAFIGTLAMALLTNYPFALASGMGLNAYFAFTVASKYGWQAALLAVFIEGVIFILLSLVSAREAIFNAIPQTLKYAVSVGIGMFIAFVGLQGAKIVVGDPSTLVTFGAIGDIRVILALIGTLLTVFFVIKKVKGALLFGILATYVLGLLCELTGLYVVNPEAQMFSLIPAGFVQLPPSIGDINLISAISTGAFSNINLLDFAVIVFSFLFVDIFDTVGTLIGVSQKAGFLDKNGKLPRVKQALLADAIGTVGGALLGTSTVTTYVESSAGVAEGGRTGLTSVVTALLFLVALFFAPIFSVIPSFATAPALIVVGIFMMESIMKINFSDFTEALPAFLTVIMMILTYSISHGLIFGGLSYVIIKFVSGRKKEIRGGMVVVALLFLLALILT